MKFFANGRAIARPFCCSVTAALSGRFAAPAPPAVEHHEQKAT
jgi:hypothetical protein